ncbi:MAG: MMPL family transporter [Bacteroidales bacterium]|nr:MMPL family transporter [Bacteroidales bacterium]
MGKFFIWIYRFFTGRRWMLYGIAALTFAVFAFFASKLKFEEDLAKLLPSSGSEDSGLVFNNLKIKDKVFVQFKADSLGHQELAAIVDEFMDSLDVTSLYAIGPDDALGLLDYALCHVPSFVDESLYPAIDEAIANVDKTMEHNAELVMADWTGSATQMVATDPFNLKSLLLPSGASAGFTVVDGHLFSPDSTVALAFISPDFQSFDSKSTTKLIKDLRRRKAAVCEAHPEVEILMHGVPVRSADNAGMTKRDLWLSVGISMLLILVVLFIAFKGLGIVWQNILPVVYGAAFSMACLYWIKGGMSFLALGIGSVVLGVALSYCLHVIIHQRYVGSVEKMLSDESTPVCLGCITTIGAFLGLLFTESELLRDFGLYATFGLIGTTFFALAFLPSMLSEKDTARTEKIFSLIGKVNSFPYDRKWWILAAVGALALVGFVFSPKVKFDNDLAHIGYVADDVRRSDALYAEKVLHGNLQRHYAVAGESLDEALTANLRLAALLDSLRAAGDIESYAPVVPALFPTMALQQERINAWKAYWTPAKEAEAKAALTASAKRHSLSPDMFEPFYAMVEGEYEPGDLYASGVVPEGLLCNFIEESGGKFLIFNSVELLPENKDKVDAAVDASGGPVVVDPLFYTGNMIELVHQDFNTTLLISSIFVFIVLLLAFRNIWISLLSFLPMFLSWYVVQGLMALFGLQFNLINIVISTFIFGIGVDYSIFVMNGLLADARGDDKTLLDYHKGAIFFSAFVLIVVVVSMLFARHPAVHSIGVCTLIGMVTTILLTYTLQPFLFRLMLKSPWLSKSILKR